MPPKKTPKTAEQQPILDGEQLVEEGPATGQMDENTTVVGDGGARDEEVGQAIQDLEALGETIDLGDEAGGVVAAATGFMLEQFKHRPKPWGAMGQKEQQDCIAALEQNSRELVRKIVEAVARQNRDSIRCLLVGFTDKGDDIKAEIKVKPLSVEEAEQAVLGLHRARGKHVLVTVATVDDYHDDPARDDSEPEQRGLGFEAGSDEIPLDPGDEDEDEVAAAQPALPADTTEVVHTGDQLVVPKSGICEARINLKSGMLEALPAGGDSETGWIDIRVASPAEFAAERERTADFVDAE